MVQPRRQPFVGRHLLHHAQPEARLLHGEIEGRRADADQRQPVIAVGGAVDVVAIAGQLIDHDLEFALARSFQPIAEDLAKRGAGDQHRLAVM